MAIFWTLQKNEAWEQFKIQGYLEGNSEHAAFEEEYLWMMEQMKSRLTKYKGEYPIWLWLVRPDMRSTGHFTGGTRCVRLTIELDVADVLVSDFYDWHSVLNKGFCADNEKEYEDYHDSKLTMTKEESWLRIFEYLRYRDPRWHGENEPRLQGVTGRIDLSRVRKIEPFITRKSSV